MTREEHLLVLAVFTKQQQIITVLADMLRSRDLASADDLRAFEFAAIQDEPSKDALMRQVKVFYLDVAKALGIETGLTPPL